MCLNPITIKNPAKAKSGGLEYIQVPCRNCEECSNVAQMDYLVRCLVLFNSLPSNYSFHFCTLTFNNENLPLTNVYRKNDVGVWEVVDSNVPTFNHAIYKRFRKNFQEYCMDSFGMPLYLLTTCEYGENKHRPHYHCICAFPSNVSWRQFKAIIERYWHYGFTKNIAISRYDKTEHNRKPINCIKYVCKYVTKFEIPWLPSYLTDDSLCTDFPLYDVKPKVFITNGFGASLENSLTHSNYVSNKVLIASFFDDSDPKSYSLPQYYRRRYFTRTFVTSTVRLPYVPSDCPYEHFINKKYVYRYTTETLRVNGYNKLLRDSFIKSVRQKIFQYNMLVNNYSKFRNYLHDLAPKNHEDDDFTDITLCPSLEQDMIRCYDENFSNARSPHTFSHYYVSDVNMTDWNTHNRAEYAKDQLYMCKNKELPWLPYTFRKLSFVRLAFTHFTSLPDDWYLVELGDLFVRCLKRNSNLIRKDKEREWYLLHHCIRE